MESLEAGYGLDQQGFIISDVSLDKIKPAYMVCVQESVEKLSQSFPEQLHSVYVYGSVGRGDAVAIKSDLDLLAIFNDPLSSDRSAELKKLALELSQKYRSLVRDIGVANTYYDYVTDPKNYDEQAFLKEICVCVHGEDLGERFGPYKLTPQIAISFNGDICDVFTRVITRLKAASNDEWKAIVQGFCRKLIRTYYSMVMARSQIWSTRLHEQCEVFISHFPDKEPIVQTLVKWLENPPTERNYVIRYFEKEGQWACENFVTEANVLKL
ncbi:nucleotidyltransferase domain-containing protein [Bacillus horti]|uniref:Nucleotidyltransferase n=1 Tax=Caldalkalibacillus horti TaxID=77523 RepID=A0ABT9W2N6_9BACI|nr:nucleotidyltransferase domain-containing protein [Bacillus horti]MDQ0167501.1 putative nucleotidyltransferase [Bacillus horti]